MALKQLSYTTYPVGILCALPHEKAAVEATLDEDHDYPGDFEDDGNSYSFGTIGGHNVVIACLPAGKTGKSAAATVGRDASRSFPIERRLIVGVDGSVPSKNHDIRLGDVILRQLEVDHGGFIQWDFGTLELGGF